MIQAQHDNRFRYLTYFLFLAAGYALLAYLHDFLKDILTSGYFDFQYYYINAKALRQGCNIWDFSTLAVIEQIKALTIQAGVPAWHSPVIYAPGFFLLVLPFTFLPLKAAAIAWVAFCQASLLVFIILMVRLLKKADLQQALISIFLVFSFWPLREELHLGQPNLVILCLFTLSLLFWKKKQFFLAGILLGLGIQIKEIFLPMLLLCMHRKYRKALLGALSSIIVVKLAVLGIFGAEKELAYWQHMSGFWYAHRGTNPYNQSVLALLGRLTTGFLNIRIAQLVFLGSGICALFVTWKALRETLETSVEGGIAKAFGLSVCLCFMLSPWVHETHLVVLYLPLLAAWPLLESNRRRLDFILFIIAYLTLGLKYSVISFEPFHKGPLSLLLSTKTLGSMVLFYLFYRLCRKDAVTRQ